VMPETFDKSDPKYWDKLACLLIRLCPRRAWAPLWETFSSERRRFGSWGRPVGDGWIQTPEGAEIHPAATAYAWLDNAAQSHGVTLGLTDKGSTVEAETINLNTPSPAGTTRPSGAAAEKAEEQGGLFGDTHNDTDGNDRKAVQRRRVA
jgi:hypothetical protein